MDRWLKRLDAVLGLTDPGVEQRISKGFWGILFPLLPVWYGASSLLVGHSKFLGRGRIAELHGTAAIWAGVGYLCLGLFLHVHNVWEEHPWFAGIADVARFVLLLVLAVALMGVFIAVLI